MSRPKPQKARKRSNNMHASDDDYDDRYEEYSEDNYQNEDEEEDYYKQDHRYDAQHRRKFVHVVSKIWLLLYVHRCSSTVNYGGLKFVKGSAHGTRGTEY